MWEDLQRQIRSLHVTVRIERLNNNNNDRTEAQRDNTANIANNPGPSTSVANSSMGASPQIESAKNYKKALLENYKRQNNESDHVRTYDHNQPSTSRGITGSARNRDNEPPQSSSDYNIEETSTNISLSNLLPSDSELRQMQTHNLKEMLDGLYSRLTSRCQNCTSDTSSTQQYATNDHTYCSLTTAATTANCDVQLPSMSSIVSNISANSNLPTVAALTADVGPLPSMSNFVSSSDRNVGSNRSTQISHATTDYSRGDENSNNNNNGGNGNNNVNSDLVRQYQPQQSGSSTSTSSPESSASSSRLRGRQYHNLRQRMYLRYLYFKEENIFLSPITIITLGFQYILFFRRLKLWALKSRNTKQISRPPATNDLFRHYENVRRPWHLRRNAPSSSSSNSERDRRQTTLHLQKMILRLESLIRQQRALARSSNINRGSDSDSQPENRDHVNQEMEQIRETTRLRAR